MTARPSIGVALMAGISSAVDDSTAAWLGNISHQDRDIARLSEEGAPGDPMRPSAVGVISKRGVHYIARHSRLTEPFLRRAVGA